MSIIQRVDGILISGEGKASPYPKLYLEIEQLPSSVEVRVKDRFGDLLTSFCLDYSEGRLELAVDDADDPAAHILTLYVADR